MSAPVPNSTLRMDILRLAWPVFVSQVAVMINGVIDTVMAGRLSANDTAAIGLGSSIYITVYVGLMGVILALSPITAQLYGARRFDEIGEMFRQTLWLCFVLAVPGCVALCSTGLWMQFSHPPEEVARITSDYLVATAWGLPAALLFRAFYALNTATSRPRTVMYLNVIALILKGPCNAVFMFGVDRLGIPALGAAGCGVATAVLAWGTVLLGGAWLMLDRTYAPLRILRWSAPRMREMRELLALGLPIGASYLIEVTSFTFMALLVAPLGAATLAAHQIASNLTGVCYMSALAIASAASTLSGQALGARDEGLAWRYAGAGLRMALQLALFVAGLLFLAREPIAAFYSSDVEVVAAAAVLIAAVAGFHFFDSLQTQCSFLLRAWRITTAPMVVCAVAMWVVGLGGGLWLCRGLPGAPPILAGALGFWVAGTAGLVLASAGMAGLLHRVWRRRV